jgi:hypothetical protein
MNHNSWWKLALVVCAFFAWSAVSLAQRGSTLEPPRTSHHLLELDDFNLDEGALADRLRRTRDLLDTQSIVQKVLKNDKLRDEFMKKYGEKKYEDFLKKAPGSLGQELLNNPELRRNLEKALEGQQFSPDDLKTLKSLAESKLGNQGRPPEVGPDLMKPPPGVQVPPPGLGQQPFMPPQMNPPEKDLTLKEQVVQQLTRLADHLDEMDEVGSGLRDVLRSFGEGGVNLDGLDTVENSFSYLPRLSDVLSGADLGSIRMPSMGGMRWPSFRGLNVSFGGGPSMPSISSAPSGSMGTAGTVILWVGIVGLLILVFWKGPAWYRQSADGQADSPWRLGAWPVQPGSVTTRKDLIRAFEYLALLILGPTAGTCHHRDLASRLGEPDQPDAVPSPERRQAAEQLARLYEQARYVPGMTVPDEPLPEQEQAAARQALCLLAGALPA